MCISVVQCVRGCIFPLIILCQAAEASQATKQGYLQLGVAFKSDSFRYSSSHSKSSCKKNKVASDIVGAIVRVVFSQNTCVCMHLFADMPA